jgi:hypothetical protein
MQEYDYSFVMGLCGLICGCLLALGIIYSFLD